MDAEQSQKQSIQIRDADLLELLEQHPRRRGQSLARFAGKLIIERLAQIEALAHAKDERILT